MHVEHNGLNPETEFQKISRVLYLMRNNDEVIFW